MDIFDNPIFCGLAVLFTILFLLNMRSFLKRLPPSFSSPCAWWYIHMAFTSRT